MGVFIKGATPLFGFGGEDGVEMALGMGEKYILVRTQRCLAAVQRIKPRCAEGGGDIFKARDLLGVARRGAVLKTVIMGKSAVLIAVSLCVVQQD